MSKWNNKAHKLWNSGRRTDAIACLLKDLNTYQTPKPKALMMQFSYYLFLLADYGAACQVLEDASRMYPNDEEVMANLVVALSRAREYNKAIVASERALTLNRENFVIYDALASCFAKVGEFDKARVAGDQALSLKDSLPNEFDSQWTLPTESIASLTEGKKRVISFSLWGNQEAYINGAVRNLLLANEFYPDWEIWIYHDSSVRGDTLGLLSQLGAKLVSQSDGQSEQLKLCWRFQVADHPDIGYFLVRDIDSVFNLRERLAVQEWLDSEAWFHTINDWWTHTDLILAGTWGGVAGVLPTVWSAAASYSPPALKTPNVDQWFLRDRIWPYIKQSCCIHDRCYRQELARPIPGPAPIGNQHIGSCEFVQNPERQRKLIQPWLNSIRKPEGT